MSVFDRVKPHIRDLAPYAPGKPIEELERELGISDSVKLASNENPLGPSPRAVEAIRGAAAEIHRYPDGASFALRAALAEKPGVSGDQLVLAASVLRANEDRLEYSDTTNAVGQLLERLLGMFLTPGPITSKNWM